MKHFQIKPQRHCKAGYPGKEQDVNVQKLLQQSLPAFFKPMTMVAAGVLGLLPFSMTQGGEEESLQKTQTEIDVEVTQLSERYLDELRSEPNECDYEDSEIVDHNFLTANPKTKHCRAANVIDIGVKFLRGKIAIPQPQLYPDTEMQIMFKAIAKEMFEAYDLNSKLDQEAVIKSDVNGEPGSAQFRMDGYDEVAGVGFEISSTHQEAFLECHTKQATHDIRKEILEPAEWPVINQAIQDGQVNLFHYQISDESAGYVDPAERIKVFIESMDDYLKWLKAEGKI